MNIQKVKNFLSHNIAFTFFISFLIGLYLPYIDNFSSYTIIIIISLNIFVSCFKINKADFKNFEAKEVISFYILRFILLPFVFYYLSKIILPEYALAIFLLTIAPAGISTPGLSIVFGGNVFKGFAILILSSILIPFLIPISLMLINVNHINIDIFSLFIDLIIMIFIPIIIHLPFRKVKKINEYIIKDNKFLSIMLISLLMVFAVATVREIFFEDFIALIKLSIISFLIFILFYFLPFLLAYKRRLTNRITYAISSGANNLALAIGIAVIYMSQDEIKFLVLAEISWVITVILFQKYLSYKNK